MTNTLKLIIPLLEQNLTPEDISEKAQFVGAYTENINSPSLTNKVFLVYEHITKTGQCYKTCRKLMRNKTHLKNWSVHRINGKMCKVFVFTLPVSMYLAKKAKTQPGLSTEEKTRLVSFWNNIDNNLIKFVLNDKIDENYFWKSTYLKEYEDLPNPLSCCSGLTITKKPNTA